MSKRKVMVDDVRIVWEPDESDGEREQESCRAVATVSYALDNPGLVVRRLEWLSSGGLYGIQLASPTDPYKAEVELEQLADLRDHLNAFGVDTRNFASRFAPSLQE